MTWSRFALAVLAAGVVSSFTDWFFGGFLFHDKYHAYPEIWRRPKGGEGETQAIVWSAILGFVTCAAFVYACSFVNLQTPGQTIGLAVLMWLAVALPLLVTNALFVKYHPLTVVAHSLGWLAKLIVCALATSLILFR